MLRGCRRGRPPTHAIVVVVVRNLRNLRSIPNNPATSTPARHYSDYYSSPRSSNRAVFSTRRQSSPSPSCGTVVSRRGLLLWTVFSRNDVLLHNQYFSPRAARHRHRRTRPVARELCEDVARRCPPTQQQFFGRFRRNDLAHRERQSPDNEAGHRRFGASASGDFDELSVFQVLPIRDDRFVQAGAETAAVEFGGAKGTEEVFVQWDERASSRRLLRLVESPEGGGCAGDPPGVSGKGVGDTSGQSGGA